MKAAIFCFMSVTVFVQWTSAVSFEIRPSANWPNVSGQFNIAEKGRYCVDLNFTGTTNGIKYGIYVHGGGTCSAYDATLSSVGVINRKTGQIKSVYGSGEYFLISAFMSVGSMATGGNSVSCDDMDFELLTNLSGKVITLQVVGADGRPSGDILNCWVHP